MQNLQVSRLRVGEGRKVPVLAAAEQGKAHALLLGGAILEIGHGYRHKAIVQHKLCKGYESPTLTGRERQYAVFAMPGANLLAGLAKTVAGGGAGVRNAGGKAGIGLVCKGTRHVGDAPLGLRCRDSLRRVGAGRRVACIRVKVTSASACSCGFLFGEKSIKTQTGSQPRVSRRSKQIALIDQGGTVPPIHGRQGFIGCALRRGIRGEEGEQNAVHCV